MWWSSISKLLWWSIRWRCDKVFDEVCDEVLYQNCCDEVFDEDVMKFCHLISRWRCDEDSMKYVMKYDEVCDEDVKRVVKRL